MEGQLAFAPPLKLPMPDEFPAITGKLLADNEVYSLQFMSEAPARQQWFDNHTFVLVISTCADGRMLDTERAFGEHWNGSGAVPRGIIEVDRSSGAISGCESVGSCFVGRNRIRKGRPVIHIQLAHWSSSHPQTASCAALNHDTKAALLIAKYNAEEMAFAFRGKIVSIHGLADTDWDSLTIFGPAGTIDTLKLACRRGLHGQNLKAQLHRKLTECFPKTCEPLSTIDASHHAAFYDEMAMYLSCNVAYVRSVIASERKVELLDHSERLLVIGRHVAPLVGYNSAFLCTDLSRRKKIDFLIGWKFVVRNTIVDAINAGNQNWLVPVIINIPTDTDDEPLTRLHVRHLQERYEDIARQNALDILDFVRSDPKIAPHLKQNGWLAQQLTVEEFVRRISWCLATSPRRTRRLTPFR
jgi:hypothetical protein